MLRLGFKAALLLNFAFLADSFELFPARISSTSRSRCQNWQQRVSPLILGAESFKLEEVESDESFQWRDKQISRRRALFSTCAFVSGAATAATAALADTDNALSELVAPAAQSSMLESGLLEVRVNENVMSPPPYELEGSDIFYPTWFSGVWDVSSTTTQVEAPCGVALFGGNATYLEAQKEIGETLTYRSRFIPNGKGDVIADREYNVKAIAKAAMGTNSVVDVSTVTPNKFSCVLSPKNSPSMLSVDLIVLARRQEDEDIAKPFNFDCAEVVRQIVSPLSQSGESPVFTPKRSSLLKEIETTSLYTAVVPKKKQEGEVTEINCRQRSATFLLPSQEDPIAMRAWEYARGRPIDVRFYDVVYTKTST